jgi:hypothetical protein
VLDWYLEVGGTGRHARVGQKVTDGAGTHAEIAQDQPTADPVGVERPADRLDG